MIMNKSNSYFRSFAAFLYIIIYFALFSCYTAASDSTASSLNKNLLQLDDTEREWLAAHPVIRVYNQPDFIPYNYYSHDHPAGYSVDYINLIAGKLGIQLQFISDLSWSDALDSLENKQLDVLLNIVKTPQRVFFVFSFS